MPVSGNLRPRLSRGIMLTSVPVHAILRPVTPRERSCREQFTQTWDTKKPQLLRRTTEVTIDKENGFQRRQWHKKEE